MISLSHSIDTSTVTSRNNDHVTLPKAVPVFHSTDLNNYEKGISPNCLDFCRKIIKKFDKKTYPINNKVLGTSLD